LVKDADLPFAMATTPGGRDAMRLLVDTSGAAIV
jgi:hypothetical protein